MIRSLSLLSIRFGLKLICKVALAMAHPNLQRTRASQPLDAIPRPRDTPIWKLEAR